jgi:trans-aconitate 2-methyltransferase
MPEWDSGQYLKFHDQRTQPCRDLAARIEIEPARVIDLGCGPGNSTEVLAARWPNAAITGLDSSPAMIESARAKHPEWHWIAGDIVAWAASGDAYDLVFSNAALQWAPDHACLIPQLLERVAPGGALAVQMPSNWNGPAHSAMRELARRFGIEHNVREWYTHEDAFYYDVLAGNAARAELWATEYLHVMDGPEAIVEWYRGTGLRPFLEALASDAERTRFASEYRDEIARAYLARADGRIIFPFRRFFFVAYTGGPTLVSAM